jgi:hypothetical protein
MGGAAYHARSRFTRRTGGQKTASWSIDAPHVLPPCLMQPLFEQDPAVYREQLIADGFNQALTRAGAHLLALHRGAQSGQGVGAGGARPRARGQRQAPARAGARRRRQPRGVWRPNPALKTPHPGPPMSSGQILGAMSRPPGRGGSGQLGRRLRLVPTPGGQTCMATSEHLVQRGSPTLPGRPGPLAPIERDLTGPPAHPRTSCRSGRRNSPRRGGA